MQTRAEIMKQKMAEDERRRSEEIAEIQKNLFDALSGFDVEVISLKENSEDWTLSVKYRFTLDGYTQEDVSFWQGDESIEDFYSKVKKHIDYIRALREQYPEYCQQNDYIQNHSNFQKSLQLTHMGYKRQYSFCVQLADYLKLPNATSCSFGGGDYEIKRTPQRVAEYNQNIDRTIDFLLDCIAELRGMKCVHPVTLYHRKAANRSE